MAIIEMAHVNYQITRVLIVNNPTTKAHGKVRICATEMNHAYPANLSWRADVHFDRHDNPAATDHRFRVGWYYSSWNTGSLLNHPAQIAVIDAALDEYVLELAADVLNIARTIADTTPSTPSTPAHASREKVINRAIAVNHKISDLDVQSSQTLREVALDYVRTYNGFNQFIHDVAIRLEDNGMLSAPQMRGALNVMIAEARTQRADAIKAVNAAFVAGKTLTEAFDNIDKLPSGKFANVVKPGDVLVCERCKAPYASKVVTSFTYDSGTNTYREDVTYDLCDACAKLATDGLAVDVFFDMTRITMRDQDAVYALGSMNRDQTVLPPVSTTLPRSQAINATNNAFVDDTNAFYLDIRSKTDKVIEAAGIAPQDNEAERRIPNGTYTIIIDASKDDYRTIKLADAPAHFNAAAGTQIASYLSGSDNEASYTGFAFVLGTTSKIWRKFINATPNTKSDSKVTQALAILLSSDDPIAHMREYVLRSARCGVCNRKLTTPDSIRMGIGPICAGKLAAEGYTFEMPGTARALAAAQPTPTPVNPAATKEERIEAARIATDAINELFD